MFNTYRYNHQVKRRIQDEEILNVQLACSNNSRHMLTRFSSLAWQDRFFRFLCGGGKRHKDKRKKARSGHARL